MRPSSTARRYAEAAFDVARRDGEVDGFLRDMRRAAQTLQDDQLAQFFKDPSIATDEKLRALESLFGEMRPHVLNLLRVLLTRYRLHLVPAILAELESLQREAQGIAEAEVTVARPIDDRERNSIATQLGQVTGKRVQVHTRVDPSILGGIVVRLGDRLIDASVAGRLQRLRQEMEV
jgi:F-type H+-transporting ATPase subunit delta